MVSKLHNILKPFLLRRVKADVEQSLPAKQEIILCAPAPWSHCAPHVCGPVGTLVWLAGAQPTCTCTNDMQSSWLGLVYCACLRQLANARIFADGIDQPVAATLSCNSAACVPKLTSAGACRYAPLTQTQRKLQDDIANRKLVEEMAATAKANNVNSSLPWLVLPWFDLPEACRWSALL